VAAFSVFGDGQNHDYVVALEREWFDG